MMIDLARLLPKSTKYFYDAFHYNNIGCKKINELIDYTGAELFDK
jgi:hypothetical protein